jgi:hypothetical protein
VLGHVLHETAVRNVTQLRSAASAAASTTGSTSRITGTLSRVRAALPSCNSRIAPPLQRHGCVDQQSELPAWITHCLS